MKDNGYQNWKELKDNQTKKRIKLLSKLILIIIILVIFIFFFGYDNSTSTEEKITNIIAGGVGLTIICTIITFLLYKIPKYIPICNKCGNKISNINKDCFISDTQFINSEEKIEYMTSTSTTEGEITNVKQPYTPYHGFGFETHVYNKEEPIKTRFTTKTSIPIKRKYYTYSLEYSCIKCKEKFCNQVIETTKKIK